MSLRNPLPLSFARACPVRAVVAAALLAAGGTALAAPPETVRVIVAYKAGDSASAKAAVAAARGQVKLEIPGMDAMAVEVPAAAVAGLQRNPKFAYVEEDVKRYPMARRSFAPAPMATGSAGQVAPYGIAMVQADQVAAGATARKICIIDSGYALGHEDLPSVGVSGTDDRGTGKWSTDENHHGTHVAGTIAALNNAVGVVGVTTDSQKIGLHIIKVFDADGWAYSSSLVTAAKACQTAGANVISMSLGGSLSSRTEQTAFETLLKANILSVAAAGNDGNKRNSFPASYPSVVSVAAVDAQKKWATFSQYNSQVELAAPGVNVRSTVPMGAGVDSSLVVGTTTYAPGGMEGSPVKSATGALFDFGIGDKVNTGAAGKVCLIARGTVDFATKVLNCQSSGGVGAVVYNNVAGGFGGTLGTTVTTIPSVTASDTEGAAMKAQIGQNATVAVTASNYANYDGTSMATPHVSAVAALVWSHFPGCNAASLRTVLQRTAEDLAPAGRDTKTGFGIVRAKNAYDFINAKPTTCGL